jgi:hypothetical protein
MPEYYAMGNSITVSIDNVEIVTTENVKMYLELEKVKKDQEQVINFIKNGGVLPGSYKYRVRKNRKKEKLPKKLRD